MHLDITALFVCLDDFTKIYEEWLRHKLISDGSKRIRKGKLSLSEMLLIRIMYHNSPFKNFKVFYECGICFLYRHYFNELPSYERFVTLQKRLFLPLSILLHML